MIIQLQSILLPTLEICNENDLYYHKSGSRIDFNGYFNLFYIEKRKKYTTISNVILEIWAQGYKELILVHSGEDLMRFPLEAQKGQKYQIIVPYSKYEVGVFWFALIEEETCTEKTISGWYLSKVDKSQFRDVNICIDICTYKREEYILRNLKQIKETILNSNSLAVATHLSIYIIDNGKTLSNDLQIQAIVEECLGKVKIIANKNTGGAGGFTRGMLEALKVPQLSHILLMDDDAIVEPDCIVRIFALVSTLKNEWKDLTIGGAMLRTDFPYLLFCSGERWEKGEITNPNLNLDIRKLENATSSRLTKASNEFLYYSGWWCCCYSLNTVTTNNLPIPLFIHHDDIEYGLRNQKNGIMFLNGICVWHKSPNTTFPGTNIYYDLRNNLIEIALHQKSKPKLIARKIFIKSMVSAIFRLKYQDVDLLIKAVSDFLKGPLWLVDQEPEILHDQIRNSAYKMRPWEDIHSTFTNSEYRTINRQIENYQKSKENATLDLKEKRRWLLLLSWNGWLLPASSLPIKVIFPTDSPYKAFRMEKLLLYEPSSKKALLLQRSYKELFKFFIKFFKSWILLEAHFTTAMNNYKKNINKITTKNSWETYFNK